MYADLHLHTNFSDGTFTPEELVEHGERVGLQVMSLTDHDTVNGCARMAVACEECGMEFIPGCEFSVEHDGDELHILGYFIDPGASILLDELAKHQGARLNRIHEMVERLNSNGVNISSKDVMEIANCDSPGRPHIGHALVNSGHCRSLDESFRKWLKKGRPAWVPKMKMTAVDAIELIHEVGGLAVIAHPGLYHRDEVIPPLAKVGLDGIECFYTRHSTSMTEHYLMLAEEYDLLVTGGSDCHGRNKGRPLIGGVKLPYEYVIKMKSAVAI
tara:strand:- start:408 stop:1223 length:816 start_codon:yes stop_codon:yes gene_type:complete